MSLADPAVREPPLAVHPHVVCSRHRETADTVTLALEPVRGDGWGSLPGQFNMMYAFGIGEVPISVSGTDAHGRVLHTIRSVGAVTRALCAARPGAVVGLRGPYGTDWGIEAAEGRDVLIIGGGIGLAPLRPAIRHVLAHRPRYGDVSILVGARSPDLLLFREEIQRWRGRFDVHVDVTVDRADDGWRGNVGLVTKLLDLAPYDPASTTAFLCGPEVMLRVTASTLADEGISPKQIRVSMERNMKCAVGLCGHCQLGPLFVCTDGPVFPYARVAGLLQIREV